MVTCKLQTNSLNPTPKSTYHYTADPPLIPTSVPIMAPQSTDVNEADLNCIGAFYDGATVFITGATGFLGKALLEKLLRSCGGIDKVYILLRPKRGQGLDQRFKDLLKNPVFDKIRDKTPEYFDKIKVICGDVSQPNLGLNELDKQLLVTNTTVAFHAAATVRFNETLKEAVILNTLGTKRVVKLCKEMRKLKSFVHVSTAYSNADKKEIEEIVYPAPYDPESIIKCVETLPLDTLNVISERIQGNHPNTYTFTKAMAENIVMENSSNFPAAIVRPSIVTAAWKEPFPGWVDNVSGISGIMMEIGRGTIRSIVCEQNYIIDVIPVDIVANTLITAAWHNATKKTNTIRVYNCTSGQVNGILWSHFGQLTLKYAIEYPSKYTSWYPGFQFRTNKIMHWICHWFQHVVPACILDILLYCTKHKPIMLRICNKFANAAKNGTFFATNEWRFSNTLLRTLTEAVRNAHDGKSFICDMSAETSDFQWDSYVENYILGIRHYVLKDDKSTLEVARTKLKRLYWASKMFQLFSLYIFLMKFLR